MKPRKKQPIITRQVILDAASWEFARHGYAATGIGALVKRAKLTKGALFHHFADKRSLACAWVDGPLAAAIEEEWITPLEAVGSLSSMIEWMRSRCMDLSATGATASLVAVAAETSLSEPVLGERLHGVFEKWRAAFMELLQRGQQAGWVHRSIRPHAEAGVLVAMVVGFCVALRGSDSEATREAFAGSLESYLETLRVP